MKNYQTPALNILVFAAEQAIAAPLDGSKLFNDGELEW